MPFPTTNASQELPAINQILSSCGQAPVTTLDQTNPEVAIAYDTLLQVSREVQAEGWTFNKEYEYKITPNTDDYILIPNNMLQIKLSEEQQLTHSGEGHKEGVRRSGQYTVEPKSFNIVNNGASGGTNGDKTALQTSTNGSGRGLTVDITIKLNVVSEIRVKEAGINYAINDTITIAKANTGTAQDVVATISATTPILGPMLYDRVHHTYKWTEATVKVDVVWLYDWIDIPNPVQNFITARAAALTSQRIVGDPEQFNVLQQQEAYARSLAMEYETNQGEHNFLGSPRGYNRNYRSFKPYHALFRR